MGMNVTRRSAGFAVLAALSLILGSTSSARAQAATQDAGAAKQAYTVPEYNAYQACAGDKNPASQVKCLDDFVSKYSNSALAWKALYSGTVYACFAAPASCVA